MRLIAFITFVLFFSAGESFACSCAEVTQERSLQIIDESSLIIEARVVSMQKTEMPEENFDYEDLPPIPKNPFFSKAKLKILDLYKGNPDKERVVAYIDTMTSCGYYFEIGDVSTFVLYEHDEVLVQADICNMPLDSDWKKLQEGGFKK